MVRNGKYLRSEKDMLVKRILLGCVLGGLVLAVYGCAPSLVGTEAGAYSSRKLYAVTAQDIARVYEATQAALKSLEIEITDTAKDVFYAKVTARSADGKRISIGIKPGADNLTHYSIQVGTLGDKQRSRVIYDKIQQNLGIRTSK